MPLEGLAEERKLPAEGEGVEGHGRGQYIAEGIEGTEVTEGTKVLFYTSVPSVPSIPSVSSNRE